MNDNKLRQLKKSMGQEGQAMVEFTLFIPIIIMLIFSITFYSRLLITQQQLIIAARMGTDLIRHVNLNENEVKSEIKKYFEENSGIDVSKLEIKVCIKGATPPPDFNPPASYVEVGYKFNIPEMFGGKEIMVSGRSEVLNDTGSLLKENHS
ncbi:MAG: hypothetical protein A2252_09485 [Elusimicrobia bacterium RIFOXYA2_FULL_39_19]|nr:MAG: hypothetical protein A2252_09485 [Elusimicrobia bacterium RIFOXYA2_FULL_39_19]